MKTIYTAEVNCRDCHKCVRICPVKAIGIVNGHATLVENSCIFCGRCVQECPRGAKKVIDSSSRLSELPDSRIKVLSLAPSFIAAFPEYSFEELVARLSKLGFSYVQETAVGAEIVSYAYKSELEQAKGPLISSCCPVTINLIEKYYPTLVKYISPTRSPMLVHAAMLREKFGKDAYIVFAGPCIGKFQEAEAYPEDVDLVITFEQLKSLLNKLPKNLEFTSLDKFVEQPAAANARFFPIRGGVIKSFMFSEETDIDIFSVSGIEDCMEVFDNLVSGEIKPRFIEAMACRGGCISGPCMLKNKCQPVKRMQVIKFATLSYSNFKDYKEVLPKLKRTFTPRPLKLKEPTEREIRDILRKIGKYSPSDEKNCGACGYNTCREKAIATFQGFAEADMCIPYMRSKAESLSNLIVDTSMDGVIVVDSKLIVQDFNQRSELFFDIAKEQIKGKSLATLIDCTEIVEAFYGNVRKEVVAKKYKEFPFVFDLRIMPIAEHNLTIIIFKDVTEVEKQKKELLEMKLSTIDKATSIINKQMQVAQEIAGLLGETTAETKSALLELITVINAKGDK